MHKRNASRIEIPPLMEWFNYFLTSSGKHSLMKDFVYMMMLEDV